MEEWEVPPFYDNWNGCRTLFITLKLHILHVLLYFNKVGVEEGGPLTFNDSWNEGPSLFMMFTIEILPPIPLHTG